MQVQKVAAHIGYSRNKNMRTLLCEESCFYVALLCQVKLIDIAVVVCCFVMSSKSHKYPA